MSGGYYTARELAGQPGMPSTERSVVRIAKRQGWPSRKRVGRGGGCEYPLATVPVETRQALLNRLIESSPHSPHTVSAVASVPDAQPIGFFTPAAQLKDWQRTTAEARLSIVAEVRRLAAIGGKESAIRAVIQGAAEGTLPQQLQQLVTVANARSGGADGKRTLSRRTLYRWLEEAVGGVGALAPKAAEKAEIPGWAPQLLKLYQQPQKPALAYAIEQLHTTIPPGVNPPTYAAARRFLKRMSVLDVQAGRMGPREHKNLRAYVKRDTGDMWPAEAYTADGHTFDAEIAHPLHGKPFRPEITTVIDIATRRAVGWSAGLAESTWAVLDALRNACETGGIPAIFYVDNGSGYRNAAMASEATGFMARLGITLTHSLPYNSQARGIIERAHQTLWVRAAKTLATYMGADMDREAKLAVYKLTRAEAKAGARSKLLTGWSDFVRFCQAQIDAYNDRPHRALPKVRGADGKLRNQSPNEAWAAAIADGWTSTPVEKAEVDDLFRPYKEAVTRRGLVQLFSNSYFARELEAHHGDTVRVGYDIHCAERVWIRDQQGRLICVAEFEGNKRSYFPESFIEQAAAKRAKGRIARAQLRIDEAEQELDPPLQLVDDPGEVFDVLQVGETGQTDSNVVALPTPIPERPRFETDAAKYRWLGRNPEAITHDDHGWMAWYRTTGEWEDLFGDFEKEEASGS